MLVPGDDDPAMGFLVIIVPPGGRAPHMTVKRGRVLHRVGAHNKPVTRGWPAAMTLAFGPRRLPPEPPQWPAHWREGP